jgi:hypothetical protein
MKSFTLLRSIVPVSFLFASATLASAGAATGAFSVVLPNGKVLSGKTRQNITLTAGQTLQVRGKFIKFDVEADTFTVRNYTLTSPITKNKPTMIWAQKAPLHGKVLTSTISVDLNNEQLVLRRSGRISMKIQAKDRSRGELFQTEPSVAMDYRHTLADGFRYYVDIFGRVVATNGMLVVRESPELAALRFPLKEVILDKTVSLWTVHAGGRMGGVVGEDALQP